MAAYAAARGWELHPETCSDEGVSGFSGANLDGDLGRFLDDLKREHFGDRRVALGVEDIDRLSRQFSLAFLPVLTDQLINAGVTISVIGKGRDFSRESIKANGFELQELLLYLQQAHDFSQKLSTRITDHRGRIRSAIRDGKPSNPGTAPAWISLVAGQWQLNAYADVARRVIEQAQAGDGAIVIAKAMNAEGVLSPGTYKARTRNPDAPAAAWGPNTVLQLLKQPAVHGARLVAAPGHNAELREWKELCARLKRQGTADEDLPPRPQRQLEPEQADYYPALLSEPEHRLLLQQLSNRKQKGHSRGEQYRWFGQTLTTCTQCGSVMNFYSSTSKRRGELQTFRYLRCTGRKKGLDCDAPLLPFVPARDHVLNRLSADGLVQMLGLGVTTTQQQELAAAIDHKESLATQLKQLEDRLQVGEQALIDADDPAELKALAKRQGSIEAQVEQCRAGLRDAEVQVEQLNRRPPAEQAATEVQQAIADLYRTFLDEKDTAAQRKQVNRHLLRLGLRIVVDSKAKQIGMAIGDGEMDWQPLAAGARKLALKQGIVDPASAWDQPGIGSAVISGDGQGVLERDSSQWPDGVDPSEAGYLQGLEDAKRLFNKG